MVKSSRKRKQRGGGGGQDRYATVNMSDVLLTDEQYKSRCNELDDYTWDPVCGNYENVQKNKKKTEAEKKAAEKKATEIEELFKNEKVREYAYNQLYPMWYKIVGNRTPWREPKYDNEIKNYIRKNFEATAKVAKEAPAAAEAPSPADTEAVAEAAGGKRRTRKGKKSKKRSAKKSRKNCRKSAKRGRR